MNLDSCIFVVCVQPLTNFDSPSKGGKIEAAFFFPPLKFRHNFGSGKALNLPSGFRA